MFPAASLPWYFRELYESGSTSYEVAASVSASSRQEPSKPYNVFVRISELGEQGFDAPTISDLLAILEFQEPLRVYCSANFYMSIEDGEPVVPVNLGSYQTHDGKFQVESYTTAIYSVHDELNRPG
jgi:hypothetical protein